MIKKASTTLCVLIICVCLVGRVHYSIAETILKDRVTVDMNSEIPPVILNNNIVTATFTSSGLISIEDIRQASQNVIISGDSWSVSLGSSVVISPDKCNAPSLTTTVHSVIYTYSNCVSQSIQVVVAYSLQQSWHFISKNISVTTKSPYLSIENVAVWAPSLTLRDSASNTWKPIVPKNPYSSNNPYACPNGQLDHIAAFFRSGLTNSRSGIFMSIQNPFWQLDTNITASIPTYGLSYSSAGYMHDASLVGLTYVSETGVVGVVILNKYSYINDGYDINIGERDAFVACLEKFHFDRKRRDSAASSVLITYVGWDSNDYQIDLASDDGQTQYRRMLDRASQLGVTHMIIAPRDTSIAANQSLASDNWGWEPVLFYSLGINIRQRKWTPLQDDVPGLIQSILSYAKQRNVKPCAYVYPVLNFQLFLNDTVAPWTYVDSSYIASANNFAADLGNQLYQNSFSATLIDFMNATESGGFAWDYTFLRSMKNVYPGSLCGCYSEWLGWTKIRRNILSAFPDSVFDNRQSAHSFSPWYMLEGSYVEPIAGDENPESYGVEYPSLSTDHVLSDNSRLQNFFFRMQLQSNERIPGFTFHQSERYDDTGKLVYDSNWHLRDFDLNGYKYSFLSSIGTGGMNIVYANLPARDVEEFNKFPSEDVQFILRWTKFAQANADFLRNTRPLLNYTIPSLTKIDGTSAIYSDRGYIFLYNSSPRNKLANITLDESIGLQVTSSVYVVEEIFPYEPSLNNDARKIISIHKYGDPLVIDVAGSSAKVLKITLESDQKKPYVIGVACERVVIKDSTAALIGVRGWTGESNIAISVILDSSQPYNISTVIVNDNAVAFTHSPSSLHFALSFAGDVIHPMLPLVPINDKPINGTVYEYVLNVSQGVINLLSSIRERYPISWVDADKNASWLQPHRLLVYPFLTGTPPDVVIYGTVDGSPITFTAAYNSRRSGTNCFTGWYWDASELKVGQYLFQLTLPSSIPFSSFHGVYLQNLDYQLTMNLLNE